MNNYLVENQWGEAPLILLLFYLDLSCHHALRLFSACFIIYGVIRFYINALQANIHAGRRARVLGV
jgi:hypothetical protein